MQHLLEHCPIADKAGPGEPAGLVQHVLLVDWRKLEAGQSHPSHRAAESQDLVPDQRPFIIDRKYADLL